ncbi:IS3 family transposase [Photorhabdus kleinii]|uniref:IS3 family transposase n=1 Tax=Photorhabdus kleinii TaxID=768034 RepID=UPI0021D4C6C2|nr:IS3 family transposase [Photorhabdus kleinii]MCT8342326.1 IS3 family transposase [Photorhabdus kleinii]
MFNQHLVSAVKPGIKPGASKTRACQCIGISVRTLQRWMESPDGQILADSRPEAIHRLPANKLSETERQQIMDICNSPEFAGLSPNVIVPTLADKGIYIASEATFYRILKVNKRLTRRRRENQYKRPDALKAVSPNQVWSWDISYLPSWIKGQHFYLYMILDIFSRKIVAAEVFLNESGEHAANLLQRAVWSEKCSIQNIILHSDNGGPMRSYTMLAKMYSLGILSSYSRPRVSNDNPYSESLFRTLKYCPWWPENGFSNIDEARNWVTRFVSWCNFEHKHSGIKYVTPDERHRGIDTQILLNRKAVYLAAHQHHPERWSKEIRNWEPIQEVYLNPEKEGA